MIAHGKKRVGKPSSFIADGNGRAAEGNAFHIHAIGPKRRAEERQLPFAELCAERGCYYLDLNAEFADADGYLSAEFAQPDGVHLTVSGYSKWVSYLCTHLPYDKDNPYQPGSTYYLSDDMKNLLADIP